jgi:hypothetical protein
MELDQAKTLASSIPTLMELSEKSTANGINHKTYKKALFNFSNESAKSAKRHTLKNSILLGIS